MFQFSSKRIKYKRDISPSALTPDCSNDHENEIVLTACSNYYQYIYCSYILGHEERYYEIYYNNLKMLW